MDTYNELQKILSSSKDEPIMIAMIEACVKFTADSLMSADTAAYFKNEYGERIYRMIIGMVEYM